MQPGSRLGPYEIVSRIGAGGMGEVWRARDTRLGREVAIKILPAEFAHDAKLKIRFEREAKVISQLTHPNICTLHDVGENYLVMELLEGESLADRLVRGPLPLSDVVRIGAEIAEAIDKGHQSGIVHRDLKPGNVMLTKSGAKLLDFGLAKSSVIDIEPDTEGATVQKPLTNQGTILGTFQYMAPEQLEGSEADARTDIFALGAVLYEMATGKRAFEGKNKTSLIAAIVGSDPRPMRQLQPLTPPALEHVVTKCLQKEPARRWQNAADVAEELRWIIEGGSHSGVAPVPTKRRPSRQWLMWCAIAGLLVIAAGLAWMLSRRLPVAQQPIESTISLELTGGLSYWSGPPAFSPDGQMLAFAADDKSGRRMLWVRSLAGSVPRALPGTDGASSPFWSFDGKYIAYITDGKLKKISADSGDSDFVADVDLGGGTWNRDGVILYSRGSRASLLRIVPGGAPEPVLDPQAIGATELRRPWFLPDGNHFVFYAGSGGSNASRSQKDGVWLATLNSQERPRFLAVADSHAMYVEPGWLLFAREGVLRAQRLDPKTLQLSGDSKAVAPVQSYSVLRYATFAASSTGLLVYQKPGSAQLSELQFRSRSGELLRTVGGREFFTSPRLSDDGRRIAVDISDDTGKGDIWIIGVDSGSRARLSFDPLNETSPVWSPDNETVAYIRGRSGIVAKRLGGVAETLVTLPDSYQGPTDWSPDGRFLALYRFGTQPGGDVLALSLATRTTIDIAITRADEGAAVFSPDSRWIAYQSDESGRYEVYVQPFPPTGAKYQVSTTGGRWPRWRVAGKIEYVDGSGHFSAAHVRTGESLAIDTPQTFPLVVNDPGYPAWSDFDVTSDDTVLVNAFVRENPAPLNLLVNWSRRLE